MKLMYFQTLQTKQNLHLPNGFLFAAVSLCNVTWKQVCAETAAVESKPGHGIFRSQVQGVPFYLQLPKHSQRVQCLFCPHWPSVWKRLPKIHHENSGETSQKQPEPRGRVVHEQPRGQSGFRGSKSFLFSSFHFCTYCFQDPLSVSSGRVFTLKL